MFTIAGSFCNTTQNEKGISIVEILISFFVMSVVLMALSKMIGNTVLTVQIQGDSNKAAMLAQDLLEEIKTKRWDENLPDGNGFVSNPSLLGIDVSENIFDKSTFDDIDDYNGYTEQPPKDSNNNPLNQYQKYKRQVEVRYVNNYLGSSITLLGDGLGSGGATSAYKRITVTTSWICGLDEKTVIIKTILVNCPK